MHGYSDSLISRFIDESTDAIQVADTDGRMVYMNREALIRLGISERDLEQYYVWDFEPLFKDKNVWFRHIDELKESHRLVIESTNLHQGSGKVIPVEVTVTISEIKGQWYIIAVSRDITERREAEKKLQDQYALQEVLMRLASEYINLPLEQINAKINETLGLLGRFASSDRVYIFDYDFSSETTSNTYEWCNEGILPAIDQLQRVPLAIIPEVVHAHKHGNHYQIQNVSEYEDGPFKEILQAQEVKSLLLIPMMNGVHCFGFVGFESVNQHKSYTVSDRSMLSLFAQMMVNIYLRTQAQKELNNTKDLLEKTGELAKVGGWEFFIGSDEYNITTVTRELLFIAPQTKIKPEDFLDYFLDGDKDLLVSSIKSCIVNGSPFELELRFKILNTDTYKWVHLIGYAERDANDWTKRIYGTVQDIDNEKRLELELAQTRQQMESIFDELQDVISAESLPGNELIFITPSASKLYEVEMIQLVHTNEYWRLFFHPDDIHIADSIQQDLLSLRDVEAEYRIITPSGSHKWVLHKSKIVRNKIGIAERIDSYLSDISSFKTVQLDLIEAKRQAEVASKAKSEFLANMSHEIRTPLNGVIGFTDLLAKTQLNPVQLQYVENANTSAHALLSIINDILDLSKIEAGKLELDEIKTDIIELLEQTADIVKYSVAKKEVELLLNIPFNVPRYIHVDPVRLKQVLVNLLGNATKFTQEGEIELKVSFEEGKGQSEGLGTFTFTVRDTGIGMSPDEMEKIGNAFMQADSSTTRKYGGTGLGLAISSSLIEKMGSRICIESEKGVGSTFYFEIQKPYEHGDKKEFTFKKVNNVLVIDDNENNRLILEHILRYYHINCVCAENGLEGIKLLEEDSTFDVIIVDYHMPYLNGLDTIQLIRDKLHLNPDKQPVILLHSSADDQLIFDRCKALGVAHKLVKPVKMHELLESLNHLECPNNSMLKHPGRVSIVKSEEANKQLSDSKHPLRILIAEDVHINMLLIKTLLCKIYGSLDIIEACDGRQAVELYQEKKPDMVFMDVQMPTLDGYAAAAEIRKYELANNVTPVPIVALTAGVIKGEKERCLEAGMNEYISKPIDNEKLKFVLDTFKRN